MKDFLKNIEKSRNTQKQLDFYSQFELFLQSSPISQMAKMKAFPVYTTRQAITAFIEKYEIYKMVKNVGGSIVECGVAAGFGLMSFAHFVSIFEPYHYVRRIIGFDTFAGFTRITEKDKGGGAQHLEEGGLCFDSYNDISESIRLHDQNRCLGNIPRIKAIKGDICETLPEYLKQDPALVVALLYLDVDLYRPTLDAIKLLADRVPKGGIIAFDELGHRDYPGETLAVMETLGLSNLRVQRLDVSSTLSYAIKE